MMTTPPHFFQLAGQKFKKLIGNQKLARAKTKIFLEKSTYKLLFGEIYGENRNCFFTPLFLTPIGGNLINGFLLG